MSKITCIGVFREREHSPQRESDDAAILTAVARQLDRRAGLIVNTTAPEALNALQNVPDVVFYMCEKKRALEQLQRLQQAGSLLINPIAGVRNTLREKMVTLLEDAAFFPSTTRVATSQAHANGLQCAWVKRGDYHAIESNDVQFAASPAALSCIIDDFARRGIASVLVQQHIPGDLVKFYGVRTPAASSRWFHWFYHRGQQLCGHAFSEKTLQEMCENAADRLGLEIFGGDAIITATGAVFIIDINAWPSFALFRETAACHIADHIVEKIHTARQTGDAHA